MFRNPLLKITKKSSPIIANKQITNIPALDIHKLAAGKLSALIDRSASRDVFDSYILFNNMGLDMNKLKTLFLAYSCMSRKTDIRRDNFCKLNHDPKDFQHRLAPMLKQSLIKEKGGMKNWSKTLIDDCEIKLKKFLPLTKNENAFLEQLLDHGEINAELIAKGTLAENIKKHPAINWAAFNAKRNKY